MESTHALAYRSRIGTAWSGAWDVGYFAPYYNASTFNITPWYNLFTEHRMPPDSIYLSAPRPLSDLEYLAGIGANYFAIIDVCNLPSGTKPIDTSDDDQAGCPVHFTEAYIAELIQTIQPTVESLRALNASQYAYVYGFDELPNTCIEQITNVFGAVKQAFPEIRTMGALDWPYMPLDLPLDIWVLQYEEYNATAALEWVAAGKQQFWYHCIEPSVASNLNTFIERPLVQVRELFWLGGLYNLYGGPSAVSYNAVCY